MAVPAGTLIGPLVQRTRYVADSPTTNGGGPGSGGTTPVVAVNVVSVAGDHTT